MKALKVAEWAKAYVALAGLLAGAGLGVAGIPLAWKLPLALVVAASGAFAVWRVPNADPPAPPLPWASAGPAWDAEHDPDWLDGLWPDDYDDDYMS